jgi:hypothetical protein
MLQTVTTGGCPSIVPLCCSHALKSGCEVEGESPFGDILLLLLRFDNRCFQGQEWVRLLYRSRGGCALGRGRTCFAIVGLGNEFIICVGVVWPAEVSCRVFLTSLLGTEKLNHYRSSVRVTSKQWWLVGLYCDSVEALVIMGRSNRAGMSNWGSPEGRMGHVCVVMRAAHDN